MISAEERISTAVVRLLRDVPFFGHLLLQLRVKVVDDPTVPTACVSAGGVVLFRRSFMETLDDAELAGILCHEVLHPALFYWGRQQGRNAMLVSPTTGRAIPAWNVAHDYAINLIIRDMIRLRPHARLKLPAFALLDDKYVGWCAEDIYEDVLRNAKSFDVDALDSGDVVADGDASDAWRRHVLDAAKRHQAQGHSLPDAIAIAVSECKVSTLSWKDLLAEWVGNTIRSGDYTYRRPSRRSEAAGEFLPSMDRSLIPDVVVLWDSSGSMTGVEDDVLGEVMGILDATDAPIRVVVCDDKVRADVPDVFSAADIVQHVSGGGGSDFCPAFESISDASNVVVVAITDGYIRVPPTQPANVQAVLWILSPNGVDPTAGRWGIPLLVKT